MQVEIEEAKARLNELVQRATQGEEIIISAAERAVKLVPVEKPAPVEQKAKKRRQMGTLEGKIWMSDDFDEPLDEMREYM